MLTTINPKLPMRDSSHTKEYYLNNLGFTLTSDYGDYLILQKDKVEIHFFEFKGLKPRKNYGQVYIRTDNIETLYQSLLDNNTPIHPNVPLQTKPWGKRSLRFSIPTTTYLPSVKRFDIYSLSRSFVILN
ncbi:MAG: VOC family protein [Cyclobacteriaceae bacterium]